MYFIYIYVYIFKIGQREVDKYITPYRRECERERECERTNTA